MNIIFQPLLRKCVIVFFDDILIYGPTMDSHYAHLTEVLSLLLSYNFFVKLWMCVFCSTTVEYLGHLITDLQLVADPEKVEAMTAWPLPRTVKQLRGLLGQMICRTQCSHSSTPLDRLVEQGFFLMVRGSRWRLLSPQSCHDACPGVTIAGIFCFETDASDVGIGAVLIGSLLQGGILRSQGIVC